MSKVKRMKRIAMIQNGIVQNIAVWDGISNWKPEGYDLVDVTDLSQVDIGWAYDGKSFSQPILENENGQS